MTHASLFSGIGGFDLAAEWAGWSNAFNCEIDPFCRRDLNHNFPNAVQYEDIKSTDFTIWRGKIDVLTGGFPCQDASLAKRHGGGQQGINGSRTGLVVEMPSEKFIEIEHACGYWIGWVDGVFVAIHQDLKTLLKTLKRYKNDS